MINNKIKQLFEAERKALYLFDEIEKRGLIISNKTETELNKEIFELLENEKATGIILEHGIFESKHGHGESRTFHFKS